MDICAYNADGDCLQLFISSKPCQYQSVPTKVLSCSYRILISAVLNLDHNICSPILQVISVQPYMTFTNRIGQNMYVKLSTGDEPKVLHASDSRVSFVYREVDDPMKLQVGGLLTL